MQKDIKEDCKEEGSKPPGKRQADPRFEPIVDFYFQRVRELTGSNPDWDDADGKNLKRWLNKNQEVNGEEFTRWLANAFQSTKSYPLPQGFRMTEFIKHRMKYMNGPLHRGNGAGGNGKRPVQIPDPKKLTKEDEAVYEQYQGGSQ